MYRVEDKFCCNAAELYYLQERLSYVLPSDSHESDAQGYKVSSLYFDDLNDSCLMDTVEGYRIRRKYRIRIYNDSLDSIKLEVKEKLGNRIYKMSKNITRKEMEKLICGECIESSDAQDDPATLFNLAVTTTGLCPKVIVTYERKAFVFGPGNVRITLDRNIRGSKDILRFGDKEMEYDFIRERDAVLEVKYDEFMPHFILQLLELGNMQQTAYSKYQLCRELYHR